MTSQRLTYLDVLKAIAIIAVVLYHAGILGYGYLGVDVFLMLTGFFATKSLAGKNDFGFVGGRRTRYRLADYLYGLKSLRMIQ